MSKAILTRYLPATNYRPPRIIAEAEPEPYRYNRVVLSWDDSLSIDENHRRAAKALTEKMKWTGLYYEGHLTHGNAYVNVSTPGAYAFKIKKQGKHT